MLYRPHPHPTDDAPGADLPADLPDTVTVTAVPPPTKGRRKAPVSLRLEAFAPQAGTAPVLCISTAAPQAPALTFTATRPGALRR
ncbi:MULTISPECIES: hypothetical protein [Ramlibacter]|uniref:Uncharacterized protein n=1 Tax=Ramlibacter pinisoli TaxID=2682844 RepID=A0A6N8ITW9_9BURK|nr:MULTISPECIES: hypothetical protein [Ramlibacter]MBA2965314.1 hypothetical protein [Ramlibacter sp. CGMCC 1.13660]MVQ30278.1 hypothetical protein [Ramlibacter pinisoli]